MSVVVSGTVVASVVVSGTVVVSGVVSATVVAYVEVVVNSSHIPHDSAHASDAFVPAEFSQLQRKSGAADT